MSATADHVLLTRFNLPSPGIEGLIRARDGWLESRVKLFQRYTVPSVIGQSQQTFTWLVYLDPESPDWLRDTFNKYAGDRVCVPIYRPSVSTADILEDAKNAQGSHADLITTNLDNDDALALDFVERLHAIKATGRTALYLSRGLILSSTGLYLRHDPSNAFCSVREKWSGAVTAWSDWHNLLTETMPGARIGGEPAWLQVVHGSNVSNRIRGHLVDPEPYRRLFADRLEQVTAPSASELLRDRLVTGPTRTMRSGVRLAAKSIVMTVGGKEAVDSVKTRLAGRSDRPTTSRVVESASRPAAVGVDGVAEHRHIILTRFNVRMPIYAYPSGNWLAERVTLFERYCLPSFRAQTCRDFRWLVFVDAQSPDWLLDRLRTSLDGLGEVALVDGVFTSTTAAQEVSRRVDTPWVITTRVDNDDAVADDFVAVVQAQFVPGAAYLINLVNGAQYSNERGYLRPYTRNPFISYVERVEDGIQTVYVRRHFELDKVAPIHNVRTRHPMWLQVVHSDNVLNELVGLRTPIKRLAPHFSAELATNECALDLVREFCAGVWKIGLRLLHKPHRMLDLISVVVAKRPTVT